MARRAIGALLLASALLHPGAAAAQSIPAHADGLGRLPAPATGVASAERRGAVAGTEAAAPGVAEPAPVTEPSATALPPTTAEPPAGQPPATRARVSAAFWIGYGAGGVARRKETTGLLPILLLPSSASLGLGVTVGPRLLVSAEWNATLGYNCFLTSNNAYGACDRVMLIHQFLALGTFYRRLKGPPDEAPAELYVRGGAGPALLRSWYEPDTTVPEGSPGGPRPGEKDWTRFGAGVLVGAGLAVPLSPSWGIDVGMDVAGQWYGSSAALPESSFTVVFRGGLALGRGSGRLRAPAGAAARGGGEGAATSTPPPAPDAGSPGTREAGAGVAPPSPEVAATNPAAERTPPPYPLRPATPTFSFGLGGAASFGRVGGGLGVTSDWWSRGLTLVALDGGLRVTTHLALVIYVDVGVGDASASVTDSCRARRLECGVAAGRLGIQARYAFMPDARATTWISAGTGWESADLTVERPADVYSIGAPGTETVSFVGWEIVKLGVGRDWRLVTLLGRGEVVHGRFIDEGHTFVLLEDDVVVDITADQFGGPPVHVGPIHDPWHLPRRWSGQAERPASPGEPSLRDDATARGRFIR